MIYVLSGGTSKAFAVIGVTYPAGSTCTCTDGTKTLKLKDTSGQGLFLIPYAETWTVTCTDGTNTKSQSFEITTEGQSESIYLDYIKYLYDADRESNTDISFQTGTGGTAKDELSFLYLKVNHDPASTTSIARAYSTSEIDLTFYNKIVVVCDVVSRSATPSATLRVSEAPDGAAISKQDLPTTIGRNTIELTITDGVRDKPYYVVLALGGYGGAYEIKVYDWYLE